MLISSHDPRDLLYPLSRSPLRQKELNPIARGPDRPVCVRDSSFTVKEIIAIEAQEPVSFFSLVMQQNRLKVTLTSDGVR